MSNNASLLPPYTDQSIRFFSEWRKGYCSWFGGPRMDGTAMGLP